MKYLKLDINARNERLSALILLKYIYAVCVCSDTMGIFVITQYALTQSFLYYSILIAG